MWRHGIGFRALAIVLLCIVAAWAETDNDVVADRRSERRLQLDAATEQATTSISEVELEKKEVEREEFSGEGEGVAYTLLCVVAFVVVSIYVISWEDDGVRQYGWVVSGMAISILSALLFFHSLEKCIASMLFSGESGEASVGFKCLFFYMLFLAFFALLQVAIGFSSGLLCARHDIDDLEIEDWVIEDHTTASHKDFVDPSRIVFKRWGRAIGTDDDGFPVFLRHRNLTMEDIELRIRSITVFLAHTSAFAAIRAGVMLQHVSFFEQNVLCSLLSVIIHTTLLLAVFRITELIRCRGKPDKLVDLYFDAVDDAEVDVLSLSVSYMLTLCLSYAVTGTSSDFQGYQLPSTISLTKAIFLFACGAMMLAGSVALVLVWRRSYAEHSWKTKVKDIVLCTLAMSFAWCILRATRWVHIDLSKKHVIGFLPASMILHVISALIMSLMGYIVVIFLDKLEDVCLNQIGALGRSFKSAVTATGLLIGYSWEICFDKSVEIVVHGQREKDGMMLLLSLAIIILLLPAWRRFILSKQLHFEASKVEHKSRSYLTKDKDMLMESLPKDARAGCLG